MIWVDVLGLCQDYVKMGDVETRDDLFLNLKGLHMKVNQNTEDSPSKVKVTNADRIRRMSDEELAEFILHKIDFCLHRRCNGKCLSCFIEWLKKEVEE